jgi:hypothetical protein
MARPCNSLLLAALPVVVAACDIATLPPSQCQEDGFLDITFVGSGFDGLADPLVSYRLTRTDDDFVEESGAAVVEDGAWEERLACGLEAGADASFYWYYDDNGDGRCGGGDRAYVEDIVAPNQDVTIEATPDRPTDPSGCAPF